MAPPKSSAVTTSPVAAWKTKAYSIAYFRVDLSLSITARLVAKSFMRKSV